MLLVNALIAQFVINMHFWVNQQSHYRLLTFECPLFELGEGGSGHLHSTFWDDQVALLSERFFVD